LDTVVLVKQVPDTATRIRLDPSGRGIVRDGVTWVVNPYDEFAIEEALKLREAHGGSVRVLTLGPQRAEEALRTALAMGADEAVRIDGETDDPLQAATALATWLKAHPFDLILTGKQAVDDDNAQIGPMVAELLDLPQATVVVELEVDPASKAVRAKREIEGGHVWVAFELPGLVTAQKGLNEPRYPSLPGIMKAKRKEIAVEAASFPELRGVELMGLSLPEPRSGGRILKDLDAESAARELVRLLHEEAKVL